MNVEIDGSYKQISWAKSILDAFRKKVDVTNLSLDDVIVFGLTDANLIINNREAISSGKSAEVVSSIGARWLEAKRVDKYNTILLEEYRTPSRGGNTSAIHSHYFTIDGESYYFKARGSKRWIYKFDSVSFAWYENEGRRIVIKGTLITTDASGNYVERGDRRAKPVQRSVGQKLPRSRGYS